MQSLIADNDYSSQANAQACGDPGITPLLAIKRESYHMPVPERFAPDVPPPETTDPLTRMAHQLGTQADGAAVPPNNWVISVSVCLAFIRL